MRRLPPPSWWYSFPFEEQSPRTQRSAVVMITKSASCYSLLPSHIYWEDRWGSTENCSSTPARSVLRSSVVNRTVSKEGASWWGSFPCTAPQASPITLSGKSRSLHKLLHHPSDVSGSCSPSASEAISKYLLLWCLASPGKWEPRSVLAR